MIQFKTKALNALVYKILAKIKFEVFIRESKWIIITYYPYAREVNPTLFDPWGIGNKVANFSNFQQSYVYDVFVFYGFLVKLDLLLYLRMLIISF